MAITTIPPEIVENGNWYQPYIHNTPENFRATREKQYAAFNLERSRAKLKIEIKKMMEQVIKFYNEKEAIFQNASGLSHKEFKRKIANIVLDAQENYRNNKVTGFKNLDLLMLAVKGDKEAIKFFNSKNLGAFSTAYMQQMFDPKNPKNKKIKKELKNPSNKMIKFQKDTEFVFKFLEDEYLKGILDSKNTPDTVFNAFMEFFFTGNIVNLPDPIEQKKLIRMINKLNETEIDFIRSFAEQQSATTLDGKIRATANKKTASRGKALASQAGSTINEVSATRLVARSIRRASLNIVGDIRTELTGQRDKAIDISDGKATFKFASTGETVTIGIDIKYTSKPEEAGRKYNRSYQRQLEVRTLKPLFETGELNAITYLLTNLYFTDSNNPLYKGYYEEIITMVQLISGLLTLLPAGEAFADFTRADMVQTVLERDTRMFVILNDRLYLMTTFLEGVKDSLFNLGSKWDAKSAVNVLKSSLETILQNVGQDMYVDRNWPKKIKGPLFDEKRPVIRKIKQVGGGYSDLQPVVNQFLGNKLLDWKYQAFTAPLYIKQ